MEQNNNYVAMKMKKHHLQDNLIMYSPIDVIKGMFDEKTNSFIEQNGKKDYAIEDIETFIDDKKSPFYMALSEKQLSETYNFTSNDEISFDDLVELYKDDFFKSVIFVKRTEGTNLLSIQETFLDDLADDYNDEDDSYEEVNLYSTADYKEMIKNNDLSMEQLTVIKEQLKNSVDELKETVDVIDGKMNITRNKTAVKEKKKMTRKELARIKKIQMYEKLFSDEKYMDIPTLIKNKTNIDVPDIEYIGSKIKKTVISQDNAIDRMLSEIVKMDLSDNDKNGIILTGSTGVGKTEILKQIAKYINRPIKIIDTTQLTAPGYVGLSIEEVLWELYIDCERDLKKAESAIIVFDEIDKKGSGRKDDVSGMAVLNTLLKFLDGTTYKASENLQYDRPGSKININTSNMIVIASGAFSDVYKNLLSDKSIGFGQNIEQKVNDPTTDDFINKAMMPDEFMGRFPVFVHLNELNVSSLKRILLLSNKSPLKDQINIFKKIGFNLVIDDEYIEEIAKKAYEKKTGARSLKEIVTETTWKPFEQILKNIGKYDTIELTKETVYNNDCFKLYNSINKEKEKILKK